MPHLKVGVLYDDHDWLAAAVKQGWRLDIYCVREDLTVEIALVRNVDLADGSYAIAAINPRGPFGVPNKPLYATVGTPESFGDGSGYVDFDTMPEALAFCDNALLELQNARVHSHA